MVRVLLNGLLNLHHGVGMLVDLELNSAMRYFQALTDWPSLALPFACVHQMVSVPCRSIYRVSAHCPTHGAHLVDPTDR